MLANNTESSLIAVNSLELLVKITSRLSEIDSNNWMYVFPVPAAVVEELLKNTIDRRAICTLENGYSWHMALMHDGQGDYFVNVSKQVRKDAGIELGDEAILSLEPDKSEYGMPVAEELVELWAIDAEALEAFHKLTRGKRRTLLYQINQPKTSATRAKRAVQYMEYLKSTNGVLDFKELNLFVKNWNQGN